MIEIKRWDTSAVIYRSENATELAYALIEALRAGTDLYRASLYRASLYRASLDGASLDGASLDPIRADVWDICSAAPAEVFALLGVLRAGNFDGSHYEGECACLVGSIANARHCDYKYIAGLKPNSDRPAVIHVATFVALRCR